jgi:hypothetical protein
MMRVIVQLLCLSITMALSVTHASLATNDQHSEVMTIQEFTKALKENPLLKMTKTEKDPLTNEEEHTIQMAEQYKNFSLGGKFDQDRGIATFKGDILVVGGGKRSGNDGHNTGLTNVEKELKSIEDLSKHIKTIMQPEARFSPVTGKKLDSQSIRTEEIASINLKIQDIKAEMHKRVLDKYFSLNIEPSVQPDFLASITSVSDMAKIPDHRFKQVIFENVDCTVFLNANTYIILSRITAPGGTIHITTGTFCDRLFPVVAEKTKWKTSIYAQLKRKTSKGIDVRLVN